MYIILKYRNLIKNKELNSTVRFILLKYTIKYN